MVDIRSEGQRQLTALALPEREVAKPLGVSPKAVGYWRRGEKLPRREARQRLRKHWDIPLEAWDQAPQWPEGEPPSPAALPSFAINATPTPLGELDRQIHELRRRQSDPNLSIAAFSRLSEAIGKHLQAKATIEAKQASTETRYWRSPAGQAFILELLTVLGDYPKAAERVLVLFEARRLE